MIIINTHSSYPHFFTKKTNTRSTKHFCKHMKIPSIFKNRASTKLSAMSEWPSCKKMDEMFTTVNSVFFDIGSGSGSDQESWFTNSSESASYTTESEDDSLESIVRGIRTSQRLFFEPVNGNSITSLILEEEEEEEEEEDGANVEKCGEALKESVVLSMESDDPYVDFKRSMEEMVESNGLKDWDSLEELLGWYLKMNGKSNHGFIVGAFVDLLLGIASSCSDDSSFLSAASSFSSPSSSPVSSPMGQKGD